jgi:hypothetical protein
MAVKAQFFVHTITKHAQMTHIAVTLMPVVRAKPLPGSEANTDWAKYTPSGKIEMNVSTESGAAEWFESKLGKDVSITFDDVPE